MLLLFTPESLILIPNLNSFSKQQVNEGGFFLTSEKFSGKINMIIWFIYKKRDNRLYVIPWGKNWDWREKDVTFSLEKDNKEKTLIIFK